MPLALIEVKEQHNLEAQPLPSLSKPSDWSLLSLYTSGSLTAAPTPPPPPPSPLALWLPVSLFGLL